MAEKIELEIVTPKGRALAETVDEVTAPSVQGEFGVLPGHLPVVAALRPGIVTYKQGNELKKVAVGPGFAEAGQNKLLILAEHFADRAGVDPVVVRKELAEVQPKLDKVLSVLESTPELEAEKKSLIEQENWLAAQLELYGDPPPPTMRPFEEWGPPPSALAEEEEAARSNDLPSGSP
ncbi:MAG: ATP synthase F1 subunit epsilon [Labilithrix sp.]|nr:ATP synthase F1 subunit epsilon [Labilithrix sp.]MCW5832964.1 ATP synthase F1 subunit epsilon [Labilithrix sp.]